MHRRWKLKTNNSLTFLLHPLFVKRLQQYVNCEIPDVQVGFRKGRGTRDQIANIRWIMEKAKEFQKNVRDIVQETGIKTIPKKKNAKMQNGSLRRPYK